MDSLWIEPSSSLNKYLLVSKKVAAKQFILVVNSYTFFYCSKDSFLVDRLYLCPHCGYLARRHVKKVFNYLEELRFYKSGVAISVYKIDQSKYNSQEKRGNNNNNNKTTTFKLKATCSRNLVLRFQSMICKRDQSKFGRVI